MPRAAENVAFRVATRTEPAFKRNNYTRGRGGVGSYVVAITSLDINQQPSAGKISASGRVHQHRLGLGCVQPSGQLPRPISASAKEGRGELGGLSFGPGGGGVGTRSTAAGYFATTYGTDCAPQRLRTGH
jgi:hypothetical protein